MKRISCLFLIFSLLLLESCLPSVELSQRAIVEAIGIDKTDDNFTVSIEYYDPNSENTQTSFIKSSSSSISLAISGISSKINKELYFGHNNIIIIGEAAAQADIVEILNYFDHDSQTKSDICILVTDVAENIVGSNREENMTPLSILEIVENSVTSGSVCEYRLFKTIGDHSGDISSFSLPFGEIGDDSCFQISATCLFKDGFLIDKLDMEKTRGLAWCHGQINDLATEINGYEIEILHCETTTQTILVNNLPIFRLNISIKIDSPEKNSENWNETEIFDTLEKIVKKEVEKTISSIFTKSKCDLFDFSKHYKNNSPDFYDIEALFNAKIEVNCSCYF